MRPGPRSPSLKRTERTKPYNGKKKTFYSDEKGTFYSGKKGTKKNGVDNIQRKLILWSGPRAIRAYAEWHEVLVTSPPRASHMIKMMAFFLALREDLGHSNRGIKHNHMARFLLRNPDLFMEQYRKNPNVTFEEIAAIEEKMGLASEFKTGLTNSSTDRQ